MPTFHASASLYTIPPSSWKKIVFNINSRLKLEYSKPPTIIPARSEVYTSLVINASPIAITGGSKDKIVA